MGDTICLASGDYGTWRGTDKKVTLEPVDGATPTMQIEFGPDTRDFTLVGMSGLGGGINETASNITIKDSSFASNVTLTGPGISGIVLDSDSFTYDIQSDGTNGNAKINVEHPSGTIADPAVTIENSQIGNGDMDGVHFGGDGSSGVVVTNNHFFNLCSVPGPNTNHTDNIQWDSIDPAATQFLISRNYITGPPGCGGQGITSFDGGTGGVTIEDNVIDIRWPWGIELYSDVGSVLRHNTVRWYSPDDCVPAFNLICGQIHIDRKTEDPAGHGTIVCDNLTSAVNREDGSPPWRATT